MLDQITVTCLRLSAITDGSFIPLIRYCRSRGKRSIDLLSRPPPLRHLPPLHGDIAIVLVQFHRTAAPPSAFGGDDLGAKAAKRFIDQIASI